MAVILNGISTGCAVNAEKQNNRSGSTCGGMLGANTPSDHIKHSHFGYLYITKMRYTVYHHM